MSTILKRFREKRKLSSELDTRWGDISISSPNEGSWNQRDHTSGWGTSPEKGKRQSSLDSLDRYDATKPRSSADYSPPIPTGYYDANVRSRPRTATSRRQPPPGSGLGIGMPQMDHSVWESDGDSSDCDSKDAPPTGQRDRFLSADIKDTAYSRASKSPPLSVTSCMRRHSHQSSSIEMTPSMREPASSKHTSITSSVPSIPIEEQPPLGNGSRRNSVQQKKHASRPKPKPLELGPRRKQGTELVGSYEDLYG